MSVAAQVFVLQLLVVVVVVATGSVLAAIDARRVGDAAARDTVFAMSEALATAPSTADALRSPDPSAILQPETEKLRELSGVAFITIMAPDRTRYTHTDPSLIGGKFIGNIEPALNGHGFTEVYAGTLGPSVRAVVPVGEPGQIIGLVSVGITTQTLAQRWHQQLPRVAVAGIAALLVCLVASVFVAWRLRRQTHGLAASELRTMFEHHEAVLHSIREGLVVMDTQRRAILVNDEARRLLDLGGGAVVATELPDFLASADPVRDELHLVESHVLLVNRNEVFWKRKRIGTAVTIRDRTELQHALGELDAVTVFAESLRSAAHESANRLHTIVTMVEMGRPDEAVKFATTELALSQQLVDRLTAAVTEPAIVALLIGKTATASERGIELTVTEETALHAPLRLPARDVVTIVGNLVDNAFDAVDPDDPWVEITISEEAGALTIRVADSGAGLDREAFARALQRGYSTKTGGVGGRGLGLALVAQIVRRERGTIAAEITYGSVITVQIPGGTR